MATIVRLSIDDYDALANSTINYGSYNADLSTPFLKAGRSFYNYVTTDRNRCVLSDSNLEYGNPQVVKCKYWSSEQSDDSCVFDSNPTLTFTFAECSTSRGVTIYYAGSWCKAHKLRITWYYGTEEASVKEFITPIREYDPFIEGTSSTYFYENKVPAATSVKIEFLETWLPNQCIVLRGLDFGELVQFGDEEIMSANYSVVCKEVNDTLEYGEASIDILDEAGVYNPCNPSGRWEELKEHLFLTLLEIENGIKISETFWYIKTFEYKKNVLSLKLFDSVGLCETRSFPGCWFTDVLARTVLTRIAAEAHIQMGVKVGFPNPTLEYCYIPPCTAREALQIWSMMCDADVQAQGYIRGLAIYPKNYTIRDEIFTDRKIETTITFDKVCTGITLNLISSVTSASERDEFYNQVLGVGKYRIIFDSPYTDLVLSGATNVTGVYRANYMDILVETAGTVTISGRLMTINYTPHHYAIDKKADISTYKVFDNLGIYCSANIDAVLERMASYYSKRQILTIDMIYRCDADNQYNDLTSDTVGKYALIQSSQDANMYAYARINKIDVDVTGGMLATVECRGFSQIVSHDFEMGVDALTMADLQLL